MQLVEKHIIDQNHRLFKEVDSLGFLSKNLFNYANYLICQKFIKEGKYLNYHDVQKLCQGTPDYLALPAKVSQQVLLRLHESWKSFFQATKEYRSHPDKFLGRPKLPLYKHKTQGRNVITYTAQAISQDWLKKGVINFSKTNIFLTTKVTEVRQVRIVPSTYHYVIEVIYHSFEIQSKSVSEAIAGIDIGLNNLAKVTSNQTGFQPILVNGKPLKSINAYYNQKKAKLQSHLTGGIQTSRRIQKLTHHRNCKIDNYLHHASCWIVNHLVAHQIWTLVIGKNDGWKQSINLGKVTNQNFVSIPHARFIQMLTYKAQLAGVKVIVIEESYTSKCSFLDAEPVGKHETYQGKRKVARRVSLQANFSRQRIQRGLFRANDGTLINADVNGSANIVRKAFPNAFAEGIQGVVVRPVRITPYKLAA